MSQRFVETGPVCCDEFLFAESKAAVLLKRSAGQRDRDLLAGACVRLACQHDWIHKNMERQKARYICNGIGAVKIYVGTSVQIGYSLSILLHLFNPSI